MVVSVGQGIHLQIDEQICFHKRGHFKISYLSTRNDLTRLFEVTHNILRFYRPMHEVILVLLHTPFLLGFCIMDHR